MANIDTSKLVNLGNLQYYDQKIKDYTKKYTDNEIAKFDFIKVVSTLPEEGLENRIYLVPVSTGADIEDENLFDEWIWVNKGTEEFPDYRWEWITKKQVEIDLTEYATKDFVEQTLLDGTW